jgi:hypothetical protein
VPNPSTWRASNDGRARMRPPRIAHDKVS